MEKKIKEIVRRILLVLESFCRFKGDTFHYMAVLMKMRVNGIILQFFFCYNADCRRISKFWTVKWPSVPLTELGQLSFYYYHHHHHHHHRRHCHCHYHYHYYYCCYHYYRCCHRHRYCYYFTYFISICYFFKNWHISSHWLSRSSFTTLFPPGSPHNPQSSACFVLNRITVAKSTFSNQNVWEIIIFYLNLGNNLMSLSWKNDDILLIVNSRLQDSYLRWKQHVNVWRWCRYCCYCRCC